MPKRPRGEKRPPRPGFRRRPNSYYGSMTRKQIALDTAKTGARWAVFTALIFVYWMAMLLLASLFLLHIWEVKLIQLVIYAIILTVVSSIVYAIVLVHRKFYY